jgi:hypothetical protein
MGERLEKRKHKNIKKRTSLSEALLLSVTLVSQWHRIAADELLSGDPV